MSEQPSIALHGSLTLADMLRFQYFNTLRRCWWLVVLAVFLLFVVAPIFLGLLVNTYPPVVSWDSVLTRGAPWVFLVLALLFVVALLPYVAAKKQYAATQEFRSEPPASHLFSVDKISSTGTSVSWSIAWSVIKTVRETNSLYLFYFAPNTAMIIPKRFFATADQLNSWRQLVDSRLDASRFEKPGTMARLC